MLSSFADDEKREIREISDLRHTRELKEIREMRDRDAEKRRGSHSVDLELDPPTKGHRKKDKEFTMMAKGLSLSVSYAANCGGMASLTGTAPNLVLRSTLDE